MKHLTHSLLRRISRLACSAIGGGLMLIVLALSPNIQPVNAQTAKLRLIHNSADPELNTIDVYVDGIRIADNLPFRNVTPYLNVPAARSFQIVVVQGSAPDMASAGFRLRSTVSPLETNGEYTAIALGLSEPTKFAPNPEGKSTIFRVIVKRNAQAKNPSKVTVFFNHGVTDLPMLDVTVPGIGMLVNNLPYSAPSEFYELTPKRYQFNLVHWDKPATLRYGYWFGDLSAYQGQQVVIFASGFMNRQGNQDGPGIGLFAALENGSVIPLQVGSVGVQAAQTPALAGLDRAATDRAGKPEGFALRGAYPNPFNPVTTVSFDLPEQALVEVRLFNLLGQQVLTIPAQTLAAGPNAGVRIDASHLPSGSYLYQVVATTSLGTEVGTGRIILMK